MLLQYPPEWKFDGVGIEISRDALKAFLELVLKTAKGNSNRWAIIEEFKAAFGVAGRSSSEGWAENDLITAMESGCSDAVSFIESLWTGVTVVQLMGVPIPSAKHINGILHECGIPLILDPPNLSITRGDAAVVQASSSSTPVILSNIPVFVRGERIGGGGFGQVYKVTRETAVGQFEYAMKVLDPSPFVEKPEKALTRFRREIDILKRLQHRGIVPYVDAGIDQEGKPYVVMPLIEGSDLFRATEGMALKNVLSLFVEIAFALTYAHSRHILHRDLKPSNIHVRSSDGQPIILDFGCAYMLDDMDIAAVTTTLIGSIGYIPPEVQADPTIHSPQHDVFACGVTLYESLARCRPIWHNYKPLADFRTEYGVIDQLIQAALAPQQERVSTMADFLERVQQLRDSI